MLVKGPHRLHLPNMDMYLKSYKEVDHCPTYDQSSCVFYLKTDTTVDKILKNRAKVIEVLP